jgi:hypothetical protein
MTRAMRDRSNQIRVKRYEAMAQRNLPRARLAVVLGGQSRAGEDFRDRVLRR